VPREVVWQGRKADPSEAVDGKAQEHNLIAVNSSSLAVTLLEAGAAVLTTASDDFASTARFRLDSYAETCLQEVLTKPSPPALVSHQPPALRWAVTHGLWLLASGVETSHHAFANYLMSVQW